MPKHDPRNLLDLIPETAVEVERTEDGQIIVLEPRFSGGFLGKYIQPRLKRKHLAIDLDEIGTVVWDACDGKRDVRAIAALLAERFGDDFDPEYQRLALFIRTMVQRGWLRYRDV